MSMKKSNDTIGYRTRDLPACSAVPQPTAPPAACPPKNISTFTEIKKRHNKYFTLLIKKIEIFKNLFHYYILLTHAVHFHHGGTLVKINILNLKNYNTHSAGSYHTTEIELLIASHHCSTSRNIAGSIPDGVTGSFH
jgi:hypothetical protein